MTTFSPNLDLHQKVANCFAFVPTDRRFAYAIRATFLALPSAALPLSRIATLVCAIDGYDWSIEREDDIRKALSLLVAKGVLRSRNDTVGKIRVWEVNY